MLPTYWDATYSVVFPFLRSPVSSMHSVNALPANACFSLVSRLSRSFSTFHGAEATQWCKACASLSPVALAMAGKVLRLISESIWNCPEFGGLEKRNLLESD